MPDYLERRLQERFGDRARWALVTGASRHPGVGSGIAGELLAAGFNVVGHCGRSARNPWLDKQAEAYAQTIVQLRKDFGDATAMSEFVDEIEQALSASASDLPSLAFDVVAHVAGLSAWGDKAPEVDLEEIQTLLHINTWSAFTLTKTLRQRERITTPGGLIVFIGSNHWYKVYSGFLGYAVTKSTVERIACHFAKDLAPHGIQVAHTTLGWVDCERHHIAQEKGLYDYEEACAVLPTGKPVAARECGGEVLGLLLTPSRIGNSSRIDAGEHLLGH
ncbi:MAG: SDR family oxidoreductase [Anaerolineae bacterium]